MDTADQNRERSLAHRRPAGAPIWFALPTAAAIPTTILALRSDRRVSSGRRRETVRAALAVGILLGASGICIWNLVDEVIAAARFGGRFGLRRIIRSGWMAVPIVALALVDLRLRIHRAHWRESGARLSVAADWIGHSMAGLALVFVSWALVSVADSIQRYGSAMTPFDISALLSAGAAVTMIIPILLAARLLTSPRPVVAVGRRLRRIGLVVLVLCGLGSQLALFRMWTDLEASGPTRDPFGWLGTAGAVLLVGAIAFLSLATTAAGVEFFRLGRPKR